jgi:hypothetical protein
MKKLRSSVVNLMDSNAILHEVKQVTVLTRWRSNSKSGTLMNAIQDALSVHRVFGLAAPTRVSPAPAAEQKQHQENDQYG